MATLTETTVCSIPLERPSFQKGTLRGRKREAIVAGSLPYFIAGQENRLVTFVAQSDVSVFDLGNPILLTGPTGSGKTVLAMHLAAQEATANPIDDQPAAVVYFPAIDFARSYAEAVAADDLPPLRQQLNEASILVIDDLHLISDKKSAQDELAARIEHRTNLGLPTLITCRRLPSEIRGMRPMLISRVLPGLTVPLVNPIGESRQLLLRELAVHLGIDIAPELLHSLDAGLAANLPARSLEAALKQVSLWCRMNDAPPSPKAIDLAIGIVGKTQELSLADIANTVAKHFRLRLSDLRSSSRKQNLVRARSLAMLIARKITAKSMHQIGDYFGGRDHTTVLHAIRKTESLLNDDVDLRRMSDEITEKLTDGVGSAGTPKNPR